MSFFFSKKNATAQEDETQDALVALDIGSSKIRLIAGEVNEDGFLSLTYYAECHSEGVVNGAITDLTKLSHQIAPIRSAIPVRSSTRSISVPSAWMSASMLFPATRTKNKICAARSA